MFFKWKESDEEEIELSPGVFLIPPPTFFNWGEMDSEMVYSALCAKDAEIIE